MAGGRPRIGLYLPTWPGRDGSNARWPEIRAIARDMEALGIDTAWAADHLMRRAPGRPAIGFRECWTTLAAAAEATTTIELGPLITCTGFRNPGLIAAEALTLDEISGGRAILGLGPGDPETDASWRSFGFDAGRHVSRFEESVQVVARLLREPPVTFSGEHFRVEDAELAAVGPRPRSIPTWVAARGERTMRIAARWGDAVNVDAPITGPADVAAVRARIAIACAAIGRDPATLSLTGIGRLALGRPASDPGRPGWMAGEPGHLAELLRAIGAAGVDHLTLDLATPDDTSPHPALTREALDLFARIFELLRHA